MISIDTKIQTLTDELQSANDLISKIRENLYLLDMINYGYKLYRVTGKNFGYHSNVPHKISYEVWTENDTTARMRRSGSNTLDVIDELVLVEDTPTYDPQTAEITRHPRNVVI